MTLTAEQKEVVLGGVYGQAENAQESARHSPEEYDLEDGERLSWEKAVDSGKDTIIYVVEADGMESALNDGYLTDDEDSGVKDLDPKAVVAYVKSLVHEGTEGITEVAS